MSGRTVPESIALEEGGPGGGDHRVTGLEAAGTSVILGRDGNGESVVHCCLRADEPEPRGHCLRRAVVSRQGLRGVAELLHVIEIDCF